MGVFGGVDVVALVVAVVVVVLGVVIVTGVVGTSLVLVLLPVNE